DILAELSRGGAKQAKATPAVQLQSALTATAALQSQSEPAIEFKAVAEGHEALTLAKPVAAQSVQTSAPLQQASATVAPHAAAQIVAAIKAEPKSGSIELRLDPPEMGRVRINLSVETADAVKAVLTVERPETLDYLRRNIDQFTQDLRAAGFASVDLEFSEQRGAFQAEGGDGLADAEQAADVSVTPRDIIYLTLRDDSKLNILV
ncbi:MAG: flagellar hook-length control protein FliK, partial [Hyphococcus sp.]